MGDAAAGRLLASDHNLEFVDLDKYNVDASASRLLPESVARHHHVVPIGRKFGAPVVAIADPTDIVALDTLRVTMGREFVTVVAPDDQIEAWLARVYRTDPASIAASAPFGGPTVPNSRSNGAGSTSTPQPPVSVAPEAPPVPVEAPPVPVEVPPVPVEAPPVPVEPLPAASVEVPAPPAAPPPGASDDSVPPAVWEVPFDTVFDSPTVEPSEVADERPIPVAEVELEPPAAPTVEPDDSGAKAETSVALFESAPAEAGVPDEMAHFPPLARVLVEGGRVDMATMHDVLAERDRTGQAVARILTVRGLVNESDLMWGMAEEMGLEFVDLDLQGMDFAAAYHLPEATARHHNVLVYRQPRRRAPGRRRRTRPTSSPWTTCAPSSVATSSPSSPRGRRSAPTSTRPTTRAATPPRLPQSAASDFDDSFDEDLGNLQAVVDDAPIVRYVNLLVLQALNERASDIHVEPTGENLRIRYRIDGVLHDISTAPRAIAVGGDHPAQGHGGHEHRRAPLPQDGRISLTVGNRSIDLRMATLPTIYGEKVVMRVLDKSNVVLGFEDLGFDDDLLDIYRSIYTKPYGTILVTGPTGSGKTTTLYATLAALNVPEKNIITVEDPVELRLKGINQVQLNIKAGLNFASALKSILRSDPDIVLVGEIRDRETAMISIEAALTGHLVLATLHTNDSASTPMRLVEMGMEPFLVTSALTAALAQRLARRLCVHCREPYEPTEAEIVTAGWTPEELFADKPTSRPVPGRRVLGLFHHRVSGPQGPARTARRPGGDRASDHRRRNG